METKSITKYVATDGSEWLKHEDAANRETIISKVKLIMLPLGEKTKDLEDGNGWIQHNLETVNCAKDAILKLCREQGYDKHYPVFKSIGRECHPLSIIGRMLDDFGGPIDRAWQRFCCIDIKGREHQQPYFAYTRGPNSRHYCLEDRS